MRPKHYVKINSYNRQQLKRAIRAHAAGQSALNLSQLADQFRLPRSTVNSIAHKLREKEQAGHTCASCGIRHKYIGCERPLCDECYFERETTPPERASARRVAYRGF